VNLFRDWKLIHLLRLQIRSLYEDCKLRNFIKIDFFSLRLKIINWILKKNLNTIFEWDSYISISGDTSIGGSSSCASVARLFLTLQASFPQFTGGHTGRLSFHYKDWFFFIKIENYKLNINKNFKYYFWMIYLYFTVRVIFRK
jgi:hypothetical protein